MIFALLVSSALAAPVPTRTPTGEYTERALVANLEHDSAELLREYEVERGRGEFVAARPTATPTGTPTVLPTPRGYYFLTKATKATPDALYVFQYYGVEVLRADPQGTVVYLNPKYVPRGHWLVTATATASPSSTPRPMRPVPREADCLKNGHIWIPWGSTDSFVRYSLGPTLREFGWTKVVVCHRCRLWREVP